jgi:ATP-binding cassette subfamily C (CFTR/MRP) protein 4
MNEIIVGIQVIKMYAWEKPFAHLIALARKWVSVCMYNVRVGAVLKDFIRCVCLFVCLQGAYMLPCKLEL